MASYPANRVVRTSDRINKGLVCTIAEGKAAHLELIQIPRTKAERGTERAFAESRSWRSTAIDTDLAGDFSGQRSKATRKVMVKVRFMVKIFTLLLIEVDPGRRMFVPIRRGPESMMRTALAEPLDSSVPLSDLSSGSSRLPAIPKRMSVVITIDAEIAPHTSDWQRDCGRFAADRDLYGITELGERGLRYQLDVIERHGLRAVIFLEALSAGVLGLDLLAEVVGLVQDRGHEVGLHVHTEWLSYYKRALLGDCYGRNMSDFSEDDQVRLIDRGLENLSRAGAGPIAALRAGNAGASTATLRAARRSGIAIDSSYFAPHLNGVCRLPSDPEISHPVCLEGIIEVPITWFRDGLNRIRPAQLCACSSGEFEHILNDAWRRGWRVVTLLLHSF